MAFAHLHVHTEYSLLDGAAKIKDLIVRASELGMESIAITDHGTMFGVIDFYKEALAAGIKPILGCEVYTAARGMKDKEPEKDKRQGHLVLLAKNNEGYRNLMKIVSLGFLEGFYYKPRIDKDVLRKYSEGIIALSACLAGEVQHKLLNGDYEGAKAEALSMNEIFGDGNFYLEIQDQGLEDEQRILPLLRKLNEETDIPLVATNDVHYVNQSDAETHDVLLCIQTAAHVDDEDRMRFFGDQFYLKSEEEMRKLFRACPEACDNTATIAAQCNVEIEFGHLHLPEFHAPDGSDNIHYLEALCEKGMKARYNIDRNDTSQEAKDLYQRLDYELSTIKEMGYVEYFLIVWDFIAYARSKDIPVGPGRGSAAGSLVSYVLQITDIDPIKYGLIFERFLNPERISMPDIDIDFCYERRNEVIDYVIDKYGSDKVSQIITFGTMKAKAAVRDVGRVLDLSYSEADSIAKAIPFDLKMTIDKALVMNPELAERYRSDKRVEKVIDLSRAIEGMPRHASTHAAGIVISKESIGNYVPLYMSDKGISTQFPMNTIEELGLLKMDFLGLRTLTVIRDALDLIEENHGKKIAFSEMGYDDPNVYEMIAEGNTLGIFQLESGGMTQFMKNLKPDCFEDIVAGIALYRPGPMASIPDYIENKKNTHNIKYINDALKPILSVTYGCIVYQEQVMRIVRDLGGYSYGRSDLVRRAMSKKKADVMQREKEYFIYGKTDDVGNIEVPGCIRNGIPEKEAEAIFNSMTSFAEYAFNKSHAAAYAVIAYETGYLKAYYPVEFMAALLTSVMGDSHQIAKYIRNCREMGIEVLPPCVKEAAAKFTVKDEAIRFGLLGVKNVGEGVIREIERLRTENGIPDNIFDFINNINIHEVNKKAIESLIKAGAFACLKGSRAQHLSVYEGLLESAQGNARKNLEGQMSLFQMDQTAEVMAAAEVGARLPDIAEFSDRKLMDFEKEMLGVYISGHPLDEYTDIIEKTATANSEDFIQGDESVGKLKDGMKVTIAGIISAKKTLVTKSNRMMAFLDLQDLYGVVEILVFPNIYEKYNMFLSDDSIIAVNGTVNFKEDEAPTLIADKISDLTDLEIRPHSSAAGPVTRSNNNIIAGGHAIKSSGIKLNIDHVNYSKVEKILISYPGNVPITIYKDGKGFKAPTNLWVEPREEFIKEITALIGVKNVKL